MEEKYLENYIELYLCELLMKIADKYNLNYYELIKYLDK